LKANFGLSSTIALTEVSLGFFRETWADNPKKVRGYLMVTSSVGRNVCQPFQAALRTHEIDPNFVVFKSHNMYIWLVHGR